MYHMSDVLLLISRRCQAKGFGGWAEARGRRCRLGTRTLGSAGATDTDCSGGAAGRRSTPDRGSDAARQTAEAVTPPTFAMVPWTDDS